MDTAINGPEGYKRELSKIIYDKQFIKENINSLRYERFKEEKFSAIKETNDIIHALHINFNQNRFLKKFHSKNCIMHSRNPDSGYRESNKMTHNK